MKNIKKFDRYESIDESISRDGMINVIKNILKEIKGSSYVGVNRDRYLMMNHIIGEFSEKLFVNEKDKDDFYYSIVEEQKPKVD